MNILVVGNGFDLAHGLKTSYMDFLEYMKTNIYKNTKRLVRKNMWIDYFLYLIDNRKLNGNKWIDLEYEIQQVIEKVQRLPDVNTTDGSRECLYKNMSIVDVIYKSNVQVNFEKDRSEYIGNLFNELKGVIAFLEEYILSCDKTIVRTLLPDISSLKIDKILSLNYTNTYARLYHELGKEDICFIHGRAGEKNLVLGCVIDNDSGKIFDKSFQRIKNDNDKKYMDWLNVDSDLTFYFFGCSLDKVDSDIIKQLVDHDNLKQIVVFYHSDDAKMSMLSNLYEIFGKARITELNLQGFLEFKRQTS